MTDLECSNCHLPIEEPERTTIIFCPRCGTELFVPTYEDWQALHDSVEFAGLLKWQEHIGEK